MELNPTFLANCGSFCYSIMPFWLIIFNRIITNVILKENVTLILDIVPSTLSKMTILEDMLHCLGTLANNVNADMSQPGPEILKKDREKSK